MLFFKRHTNIRELTEAFNEATGEPSSLEQRLLGFRRTLAARPMPTPRAKKGARKA